MTRGFLIPAIIIGLVYLLAACGEPPPSEVQTPVVALAPSSTPSPTATRTPSPTPTPTASPSPTQTTSPTPTATPTATPSLTHSPTATRTPLPTPTPSPSPTPVPTYTPLPTSTPISTLQQTANLKPYRPRGWDGPVVAANQPGVFRNTALSVDDTTYLSWAITNTGPSDVDQVFFIDLYIDDVFVQRWRGSGVQADRVRFIDSWIGLENRVRPGPGSHTLKVIVDSTNLVPELDESDNTFEREFVWEESKLAVVTPTPLPERLPDITVFTPKGWEAPLLATSYPGDTRDGPLSVDVPTFVHFGIANNGPASTPEFVWVYLYIDDVLIDNVSWYGLLAYRSSEVVGRDNILEIISLAPGVHTLRVVVDATNRVIESDESNNVLEREFTWGSGPVPPKPIALPTAEPTPPAPLAARPRII